MCLCEIYPIIGGRGLIIRGRGGHSVDSVERGCSVVVTGNGKGGGVLGGREDMGDVCVCVCVWKGRERGKEIHFTFHNNTGES